MEAKSKKEKKQLAVENGSTDGKVTHSRNHEYQKESDVENSSEAILWTQIDRRVIFSLPATLISNLDEILEAYTKIEKGIKHDML